MELWDAYDSQFRKLEGVTLVRGEEEQMKPGVYHLVCDILVRHRDGTYLLMQRDPRKTNPSMWEASAGGSALQGETALQCGIRELREETGIISGDLKEVGRVVSPMTHSVYVCFLCETDCDKDAITLQEGETVAFVWVSREELISMSPKKLLTYRVQSFLDELHRKDITVSCGDGLVSIRVGAIIMRDGKFLMVGNDRDNYLYSVGGRIQFGETAEQAVVREVMEETGFRMEVDRLGFVHENYFYGDAPSNLGKVIYETSYYFYMKVPEDFCPVSEEFAEGEAKERLTWATVDDKRKFFPQFFREELRHPERVLKHMVTNETEA